MSTPNRHLNLAELNRTMLSRRGALKLSLGAVGTAAAMPLLAACGEDDEGDDGETTDPGAGDDTEDESEETEEETEEEDEEPADEADDEDGEDEEAAEGEPQQGGELRYALSSDPPNLDPHLSTGTAARAVKLQVYNSLLMYGDDAEILAALANDWEVSESADEYSFTLREDVTFHDGSEFTVDDVITSFERIQDESTGAQRGPELRTVSEMNSDGDYDLTLMLDEPNVALLQYLAQPETSILSSQFLEEDGDPDSEMVGTGPFVFTNYEPGVEIAFERNEDYWREGYPYLDSIVFTPYPDENTRVSAIQGGDADIADYIPWQDYQTIQDNEELVLVNSEQSSFMCIQYNVEREPFGDPAVRRALSYAFDREAIVQSAFFGNANPITGGLLPPDNFAYHEELEGTFTYDPEQAQQLLAEAGYEDGFSATLMSTSQYGMHQNTAEVAEANLSDIGIDVELELLDWATVTDRWNEGDYDFRVHGLGPDSDDPDFLTLFFYPGSVHSSSTGFEDEEIADLLDEGRSTTDQDERIEIYHQVEERLVDLCPFTFLVYREDAEAIQSYVNGYRRLTGGVGFLSGVFLQEVWLDQ